MFWGILVSFDDYWWFSGSLYIYLNQYNRFTSTEQRYRYPAEKYLDENCRMESGQRRPSLRTFQSGAECAHLSLPVLSARPGFVGRTGWSIVPFPLWLVDSWRLFTPRYQTGPSILTKKTLLDSTSKPLSCTNDEVIVRVAEKRNESGFGRSPKNCILRCAMFHFARGWMKEGPEPIFQNIVT